MDRKRRKPVDKPLVTRSLHSPPLPISSRTLQISEKLLCVRPLNLVLDTLVAPLIERLALLEDAFVSLPIVRLLETYGISSSLVSVLTAVFAGLQVRRALQRQRDLTLLLLGTLWPIWRTLSVPDSASKPRRIEAFWTIFAALHAFDAIKVHPHPLLEGGEESIPITSTLYYRFRPVLRLAEQFQRAVQMRLWGTEAAAGPSIFPEPLPYYRRRSQPISTLPRLSLAMRTFGTNWPIVKLLVLWALSLNDFALANRILAPFRSPRPLPQGRRVVTVVTLQDAPVAPSDEPRGLSSSPTPPPSPPKTPEVVQRDYVTVASETHHGELADAHRVWAKSHDGSVYEQTT